MNVLQHRWPHFKSDKYPYLRTYEQNYRDCTLFITCVGGIFGFHMEKNITPIWICEQNGYPPLSWYVLYSPFV